MSKPFRLDVMPACPTEILPQSGRPARRLFVGVVHLLTAAVFMAGCVSSRSVIESLAKTPHHPVQDSARFSSFNPFQQDFLYLTETVRETHPEPYVAWSKEEFDQLQSATLEMLALDTTRLAFEGAVRSFLSRIMDSHTAAYLTWSGGSLEYPVSFFWNADTLVLAAVPRDDDTTLIGSRVLTFNGHPVDEVFSRFRRFVTSDNIYQARRALAYYFVLPTFHRQAGIIDSDTLELELLARDGSTRMRRLLPIEKPDRVTPEQSQTVTERINRPFRYTIVASDSVCYLQWNAMVDLRAARQLSFPLNILAYPVAWYMRIGYFDSFLEGMFEEMQDEGVRTLVVDLRGNGGGGSVYGEQLLYHLDVPSNIRPFSMAVRFSPLYREFFPETYAEYAAGYAKRFEGRQLPDSLLVTSHFMPVDSVEETWQGSVTDPESDFYIAPERTVFKGKVYFLVGDGTFSSAIILASMVKDNKLFTTVGQPTRGRPSHYGETLVLKLPHSGIVCRISCKKFFRPDAANDAQDALYPDVTIWRTADDLLHGHDPVFDWVVKDAKGRR